MKKGIFLLAVLVSILALFLFVAPIPYSTSGGTETNFLGQWYQENVAANQTDVILDLLGAAAGVAVRTEAIMLKSGSVIGLAVYSNAPRTNGTLTVKISKNVVGGTLTAVLDGTNPQTKVTTQLSGIDTFVAGDRIGVFITTDGSWTPTSADIIVDALIQY